MTPTQRIYAEVICRLYTDSCYSIRRISSILEDSYSVRIGRNEVHDILRARGVDTSKSRGCHRTVICATCGTQFTRDRSRHRHSIGRGPSAHAPWRTFCDAICRRVWLEEHCKGQTAARRLVESITGTALPEDAVAHFIDDNTSNVQKRNIRVFTSTERHVQEHRAMRKEE